MNKNFRLPTYSNIQRKLFFALHADLVDSRDGCVSGGDLEGLKAIKGYLKAGFEDPVGEFQRKFRKIREYKKIPIIAAARKTIGSMINEYTESGQIQICRSLVSCGLIAAPTVFPDIYLDHLRKIDSAKGMIEEKYCSLVPNILPAVGIGSSYNIQMLMLDKEDQLVKSWRDPKFDPVEKASCWPNKDDMPECSSRERMKIMLNALNKAVSSNSYRGPA